MSVDHSWEQLWALFGLQVLRGACGMLAVYTWLTREGHAIGFRNSVLTDQARSVIMKVHENKCLPGRCLLFQGVKVKHQVIYPSKHILTPALITAKKQWKMVYLYATKYQSMAWNFTTGSFLSDLTQGLNTYSRFRHPGPQ